MWLGLGSKSIAASPKSSKETTIRVRNSISEARRETNLCCPNQVEEKEVAFQIRQYGARTQPRTAFTFGIDLRTLPN